MAINGNLKDISFVELLRLVGGRTGRLCIFDFNGKRQYEWYLKQNYLYGVRINQTSLTDDEAIYQTALALALDNTSSYIFYKQEAANKFPLEIIIPLGKLMSKALPGATASTEHSYAQHFPHHDTRFEAIANASVALFDETLRFWEQTSDLLRQGASASDIAYKTLLDVEHVCAELYKLKLLGAIRPIRVFAQSVEATTVRLPEIPPLSNVAVGKSETIPDAAAASLDAYPNPENNLKSIERKNLVRRMLGSLFGKQKPISQ